MKRGPHVRVARAIVVIALAAAPLAMAGVAFADDPVVQSTATVSNGAELREQWALGNNTLITLTGNIDLGVDGSDNPICNTGEPVRSSSTSGAITIDGQGLYGITQTCDDQRVLRDDAGGETVTLTGLTHFTGGHADGHGGGLRNNGPVVVTDSNVSGNFAYSTGLCEVAADDANAQVICEDGDGGGIFAGSDVLAVVVDPNAPITITNSTIANNEADDDGGGVYTNDTLTATNSTFEGNVAHGDALGGGRGGGAFAGDGVSSTSTSFLGNQALCGIFNVNAAIPVDGTCGAVASGGGFFSYGSATVTGSTFDSNHAYDTGGGFFASDADVSTSTFTNNSAGGISAEAAGFSADQFPSALAGRVGAAISDQGSTDCTCSGGGFAVGITVGPLSVPEGAAQVASSTFTNNSALCNAYCLGSGGGLFAGGGADVSDSTFTGNLAGCFVSCGAFGGGAYSGGGSSVDTSTFHENQVGCIEDCGAEGGGLFSGSSIDTLGAIEGLGDKLPQGASAAAAGDGNLEISQTTFSSNSAACALGFCNGSGGGVFSASNPTVDVTASTFNDNLAVSDGGAISVNGGFSINVICSQPCSSTEATITNSTVTGNVSGFPAAVSVGSEGDSLTLVNDTIDSNTVFETQTCAAVCSGSEPKANVCECLAANVLAFDLTSFGTAVTHPILGTPETPAATFSDVENCWVGGVDSQGFNFSDDDSCEFDQSTDDVADGNDPMLGALADNGGPTQTMLPLAGSPLIDAIQPVSECQVDVDQRGVSRPQIKGCDTGAVEVLGASLQVEKVVTGTAGNAVPATGYSFDVSCSDGSAATLTVADATNGGPSDVLDDILPGSTCTVVEAPVVYTNPAIVTQPTVTYSPASTTSPLGEGEAATVTVTNNYEGIDLLGIAVVITPKFTG